MKKIEEFESLRGLLAVWVVISHVLLSLGITYETLPRGVRIISRADYAVDIFIILSGFVITHLIVARKEPYRVFIRRRFFRLYPVYIICFAFSVLAWPLLQDNVSNLTSASPEYFKLAEGNLQRERDYFGQHILAHLTLMHGALPDQWLPGSAYAILGPAWSASLEWQFYLIAPFWCGLFQWRRDLGVATAFVITLAVSLSVIPKVSESFSMPSFLPLKIWLFWIGIFSYFIWQRLATSPAIPRLPAYLLFGLAPVIWIFTLSLPLALWTVCLAVAYAGMTGDPGTCSAASALLKAPALQWVGKISYPLYLVHCPCIIVLTWLVRRIAPGAALETLIISLLATTLGVSLLLSWLLNRWVEEPMIRWAKDCRPKTPAVPQPVG